VELDWQLWLRFLLPSHPNIITVFNGVLAEAVILPPPLTFITVVYGLLAQEELDRKLLSFLLLLPSLQLSMDSWPKRNLTGSCHPLGSSYLHYSCLWTPGRGGT
jgi:hypothetical protein